MQTANPSDSFGNIYGPWDDYGVAHPWVFWQYASTGRLNSFNNGNSNLDLNVAHGGMEFLKDQLIPAVWWNDSSGNWSTLANWNSGQPVIVPIDAPGQLDPIGDQTLPTPRLPGAVGSGPTDGHNDTVILDRPGVNITVTLSSGTHNIRKLYVREAFNITGGSLDRELRAGGGIHADVGAILGGGLDLRRGELDPSHSIRRSRDDLHRRQRVADVRHADARARRHAGKAPRERRRDDHRSVRRNGQDRDQRGCLEHRPGRSRRRDAPFNVVNGAAATDLDVQVPVVNGGLTKTGAGTMLLSGASNYVGLTTVSQGKLKIDGSIANSAVSVSGGASLGGRGSIAGTVVVAGGSSAATRGTVDLTDGAPGTLWLTNANASATVLTLGGSAGNASLMTLEVGAAGADRVLVDAGKLVVNPGGAIITVTPLPGFGIGTYDLD